MLAPVRYLSELLKNGAQVLVFGQSVGGGGSAVLQLRLQLQEATPVVGLP